LRFLSAALGLTLLLGVMRTDSMAGMVLKFFFAKLVYSTSDGAVLFLLGFSALSLLCMPLVLQPRTLKVAAILLWGGLVMGYGAHLAATLIYFTDYQIPFSAHVYHWVDGVNSYTSLLHSHQGKAAMFADAGWLSSSSRYDTGQALAAVVPATISWLIGIAFVAALTGALLRMPALHEGYGHRIGLVIAYLVALATVLKSIFDGGLLAYAVPPSLVLIASFTLNRSETEWRGFWRRYGLSIGSIAVAGYASLWIVLTPGNEFPLLGPWLFYLAVLVLLSTEKWHGIAAWITRIALLGYLAINCLFDYGDNLAPLLRPLASDDRIISFDTGGQMTLHPAEAYCTQPVFRVYRDHGDDPWKPHNTLIWNGSPHGLRHLSASLMTVTWQGRQGELAPTPALRVEKIGITDTNWIRIGFSVNSDKLPPIMAYGIGSALSRNNYYVWLYQIDLLLRNAGWRNYVLLPHTAGNPAFAVQ
jgi:hypothetical protein